MLIVFFCASSDVGRALHASWIFLVFSLLYAGCGGGAPVVAQRRSGVLRRIDWFEKRFVVPTVLSVLVVSAAGVTGWMIGAAVEAPLHVTIGGLFGGTAFWLCAVAMNRFIARRNQR